MNKDEKWEFLIWILGFKALIACVKDIYLTPVSNICEVALPSLF